MAVRKKPEDCGVYVIATPSGKRYIGSSICFPQRKWVHLSELRNGVHHNQSLLDEYRRYGADSFIFELVENCAPDDLIAREQAHIDASDPSILHNECLIAGALPRTALTEARKQEMRQAMLGNKYSLGIKRSSETRARMSSGQKLRAEREKRDGTERARSEKISQSTNTSGYRGVCLHKASNKWQAQIRIDGKRKYLGSFDTPELAYEAICDFKG